MALKKPSSPVAPSATDNSSGIALPFLPAGTTAKPTVPARDATPAPARANKRRCTNKRVEICPAQLESEFAAALASHGSAEIAVAHLVNKYNFDIKCFLNKITGK